MNTCRRHLQLALLLLLSLASTRPAIAADGPLQLLVGAWSARVDTVKPQTSSVTYDETYRWVLDGRFLEGRSERKSDGSQDLVYATRDAATKGFLFWTFSSTGRYLNLPAATWSPERRTLHWKNPPSSDIYFDTSVVFVDQRTRRWTVLVKDWKGKVLLQQEGFAERR